MDNEADLIGAAEAAKILAVDRTTVSRLARSGDFPVAVKMPGRTGAFLFDRAEILKYASATADN